MAYLTINEVRETFKVPESVLSSEDFTRFEPEAEKIIEKFTGMWFEKRDETIKVDGNGEYTLFLPVPIIAVTKITLDDIDFSAEELADTEIYIYAGESYPDNRKNPKIVAPVLFTEGDRNVAIEGSFGYCEYSNGGSPTYSTPPSIKRATLLIILNFLNISPADSAAQDNLKRRFIIEERTDQHQVKFDKAVISKPTGDPMVDMILQRYRPARLPRYV